MAATSPCAPTWQPEINAHSRELLAALVASSSDAIVTKTLDGIVTSWNPAAERIFGYAAEEIIGQPIQLLLPPDRLSEEQAILRQIRQGVRVEHFETLRVCKNGIQIAVSVTVSPILNEQGDVIGASKLPATSRKSAAPKTSCARTAPSCSGRSVLPRASCRR
jgi:PAS domain S-box-containing protein